MQKILFRRVMRELKNNVFRYLALFLLVTLCMFIVVGIIGSADSLISTVNQAAVKNRLEDGQFGVFTPLKDNELQELEDMGVILEPCFYLDFQMDDNSTLRIMKNRRKNNLLKPYMGQPAADNREIFIERLYAAAHQVSIGDAITIAGTGFTVSGIGTSADYDHCLQNMADMSSDGRIFGTAFVTDEAYDALLLSGQALHAEEHRYSYRLGDCVSDTEFKDALLKLKIDPQEIQKPLFQELPDEPLPVDIHNLTDFVKASDNPRIKSANRDVEINIKVGLVTGIIVLALITFVVSVFVVHSIDMESSMIGALYALGLKQRQLMLHYTVLPVLICLSGGILGTCLGYSDLGISLMTGASSSYFSTPAITTTYTPWLILYGIVVPPLIAFAVNLLIIRRRLMRSALTLLRREQPQRKSSRIMFPGCSYFKTFQLRQILREKRSCLALLAGMFVSLLILVLGLNCYALCRNIQKQNAEDTKYGYMYHLKYPDDEIPENVYISYVAGLKKEVLGYDMELSVIGLSSDNPFFPAITSRRKNELSVSSSAAGKYGLSAGDKLILRDDVSEKLYGFTVKEVVPYSVGLCGFMDMGSMRELFEQADDYYNVIYSREALDIDADRLYSVSTQADVKKSSDIFMEIMMPLMTMMTSVSVLIFLTVMYQMMKVMLDRAARSISLMKIFGYRNREIRRLYLDGNLLLTAAGALLMIPAAKLLMDFLYPVFIANVACGVDLSWPQLLYVIVYAFILLSYYLIRAVLMKRIGRISPSELLRNRE
ncbi:FtsX-like permease family protein [Ruminococcus gauvreauii]|uniref:FtsX-like permease family protein n=1 Tax=Ruminococcus gauvreauii TaxID=438033 RepID=UPI0039843462